MINIANMTDKEIVKENYKDTGKLKLRKSIHEKYSTNKVGFLNWMFSQYSFGKEKKVLELGSGRGEMWEAYFENQELLGYHMDITLSDLSDGMVNHLKELFAGKNISIKEIDIEKIPFEDETFDIIIANSMLYHVKNIELALSEVKRVLKKDGKFYCSTFGENGMTKYLYDSLTEIGIPYKNDTNLSFTLQNGGNQLKKFFDCVEEFDYEDSLKIDKVEDYVDYIYSMSSLQGMQQELYPELVKYFEAKKEDGFLYIPKEYGMFVSGF